MTTYTVDNGKNQVKTVYANKAAFENHEWARWAERKLDSNRRMIEKLEKKKALPAYAEYVGEINEEIEELNFYNRYLPHFGWMRMGEFYAQGGVLN